MPRLAEPPMLIDFIKPGDDYQTICRDVLRTHGYVKGEQAIKDCAHGLFLISCAFEDDLHRLWEFETFAESAKKAIAAHHRALRRPRKTFGRHCNSADVIRFAALGVRL